MTNNQQQIGKEENRKKDITKERDYERKRLRKKEITKERD